jgi:Kef-type K+ transport system membrane component KefB
LLELGVAVVLFEAGGRIPLRWFKHNPMVLVQSLLESSLTLIGVYYAMHWMGVHDEIAQPLAMLAMAASPSVLARVLIDTRASGPVSERAMVLARGGKVAGTLTLTDSFYPVLVVLGLSVVVGAVLALVMRSALRVMSPTSENTAILLLAVIATGAALTAHFGGSAPLAALIGGMLLKQLTPRPWSWPRQMGTASSMLTMLMFVLVSVVAAQADWSVPVAGLVAAFVAMRVLAKIIGLALGNLGSGASWQQALSVGCAMSPMSSVALLLVSTFMTASPQLGTKIASIALPALLLMEVLGAVLASVAIKRAGESSRPPKLQIRPPSKGPVHES